MAKQKTPLGKAVSLVFWFALTVGGVAFLIWFVGDVLPAAKSSTMGYLVRRSADAGGVGRDVAYVVWSLIGGLLVFGLILGVAINIRDRNKK